jgi:flavin reductase (DIM6/NTAB) family NADH-FMN oxidoreductase RutF
MIENIKFKEAMSLIPTSVAIAWLANEKKQFFGCTISSFISVSIIQESEQVAFLLRTNSRTGERIRNSKNFKISILSKDQIEIAKIFSRGLGITELNLATEEYPLWFEESVCEFSLTMEQEVVLSNSTIFIANVTSFLSRPNLQPLVYIAREYL